MLREDVEGHFHIFKSVQGGGKVKKFKLMVMYLTLSVLMMLFQMSLEVVISEDLVKSSHGYLMRFPWDVIWTRFVSNFGGL